ncbi:MAG: hypothetical protein LBJ98_05120 [Endomicrobium sp.]|jgi:hypothetical protein|nr:hypothetical protein [Endomicrobium sp.]
MNKYFLVILLFLLCFYEICNGGQSITVDGGTIDARIAGNGDPDNLGKFPFNNVTNKNSLTCKNIRIVNNIVISGSYSDLLNAVNSFNVLNIENTFNSDNDSYLRGSYNISILNDSTDENNEVNIFEGTTIESIGSIIISGSVQASNSYNNKVNILPNSSLVGGKNVSIFGAAFFRIDSTNDLMNYEMKGNKVSIGEGCVLKSSSTYITLCGVYVNINSSTSINNINIADNSVTISKDVTLNARENAITILGVYFYSYDTDPSSSLIIANNTLNFYANKEYKVTKVGNFTKYNFFLHEGIKNNNTVLSFDSGQNLASSDTVQSLNLDGVNIDVEVAKESSIHVTSSFIPPSSLLI